MSKEIRVFGPPGVGKTEKLASEIVPMLVEKYGADKVMLTSFTKAAAKELSLRVHDIDPSMVGTLHSFCFRALKQPPLTEKHLLEWNSQFPKYDFNAENSLGKQCAAQYQICRNKMIPITSWPPDIQAFGKAWQDWKDQFGYMDFIDIIEQGGKFFSPPGSPSVIVADEAQDFTKLEMDLLRQWGMQVQELWLTGDPDQCSMEGSVIETKNGPKSIETLDPLVDQLHVYSKDRAMTIGKRKAFNFTIQNRLYSGTQYNFHANGRVHSCTDNHLWNLKWRSDKRKTKWKVVYLMEKNGWYRVGYCQLFRDEKSQNEMNSFHPRVRMNQEKATNLWILKIFDDSGDASIYETYISAKYGITQCLFKGQESVNSRCLYSQHRIDWLFNRLGQQLDRAIQLLTDHDLNIQYPVHSSVPPNKILKSIFKMRSINVAKFTEVNDFFQVPVQTDTDYIRWENLIVTTQRVEGVRVYSLDVEQYHTYIADGLCTCNCIYSFSGASAENMVFPEIPEEDKIFLNKSWRVPVAVHKVAQRIIKQVVVRELGSDFQPKDEEGKVMNGEGGYDDPGWVVHSANDFPGTSMILASCNYMLQPILKELRDKGVPFSNPWRKEEKSWNPLDTKGTEVLKLFLDIGEDEEYWTAQQFVGWADYVRVGPEGLIRKQGKAGIKRLKEIIEEQPDMLGLHTCREFIADILSEGALQSALDRNVNWLFPNLVKKQQETISYALRVYKKHGKDALFHDPSIHPGTIHAVKGAGANNVFIYPDISYASSLEADQQEGYDNLCRLFYVGVTRTKDTLILMPQTSGNFFEI